MLFFASNITLCIFGKEKYIWQRARRGYGAAENHYQQIDKEMGKLMSYEQTEEVNDAERWQ